MKKIATIMAAAALTLSCSACNDETKIKLAENGTALAPIVLSDSPSRAEQYAANELKNHLDKIAGANFKILKLSEANNVASAIYLGDSPKTRELLPNFDPRKAKYDTVVVKTVDKNLAISGHYKRGAMFAVCTFLEDNLGVRWWTPQDSFIPDKPTLEIGAIDYAYSPALEYRKTNIILGSYDPAFCVRIKNGALPMPNGKLRSEVDESYAVGYHSFYRVMPPKKYFKDHPEWFSEIDGKRTCDNAQLCLSNEDMVKEFAKNILNHLKAHPRARFVHVSQNDWRKPCECAKCKAFEATHGGEPSASIVNFANKIGEAIEKDYPDTRVVTFAYQYGRHAPKNIKPRKNVWIELCSIECDFAHPLESDTDYGFTKDIKDWAKLTKNMTIWNYTTCFSNYIVPYPNFFNIAPDIRFFVKNGAIGLFEQDNSYCNIGDFQPLRQWVMSKLMWNPSLDTRELAREFIDGCYAPEITELYMKYLDTINKRASIVKYAQNCDNTDTLTWMDIDTFNKASSLMSRALKIAKRLESENPKKYKGLVRKVWRDKLPIDYVGIVNYTQLRRMAERDGKTVKYPKDLPSATKDLFNRFNNFATPRIVPYMPRADFEKLWPEFIARVNAQESYLKSNPKAFKSPDLAEKFASGTYAEFQEDRIEQGGCGWKGWDAIPCEYVADKDASNGYAAKITNYKRCEIQLRDNLLKLKSASGDPDSDKFKVFIWIKNTGKEIAKGKLTWLNYNRASSKRLQREPMPAIPHTDKYEMFEVGPLVHPDIKALRKDARSMQFLIYVGLNDNRRILIDRIAFVRQ